MKKVLIALFAISAMTSCSSDPNTETDKPKEIVLTRSEQDLFNAQNEFSFDLINTIGTERRAENWVITPFSDFVTLSMLANGANDEILEEFIKVLKFPEGSTMEDVNLYNKKMLSEITALDTSTDISIVSSVWVNDQFSVNSGFPELANGYYGATTGSFPESTLYTDPHNPVNQWYSSTLGHPYIMKPSLSIPYSVSASVFRFKAEWAVKFPESNTTEKEFSNYDGSKSLVSTMYNNTSVASHYFNPFNPDADVLRLNFNGAYSIWIFLPETDINDFISNFTSRSFKDLYQDNTVEFHISLPKFNINTEEDITQALCRMGLHKTIEEKGMSDKFSRFYSIPDSYLNKNSETFHHSSYVNFGIDEDGGEVKTATSSVTEGDLIVPGPTKILDFNVNRPFFFMIMEKSTDTVLAAGAIYKL